MFELRYIVLKKEEGLENLMNEVDKRLLDFSFSRPYNIQYQTILDERKANIFIERIYIRSDGIVSAKFFPYGDYPMQDIHDKVKGNCHGLLMFLNMNPEIIKIIDRNLPSIKRQDL